MTTDLDHETAWLAGSPWREMRLSKKEFDSGSGLRFAEASKTTVEGRKARWILTEEDHAGILIPAAHKDVSKKIEGSARLRVGKQFLEGASWFRLECGDRDLEPVFQRFCDSVLSEIAKGVNSRKAIVEVLQRYRQLFAADDAQIEAERIVGLFCELVALHWLLSNNILSAAVAWIGPTKETHDFVFEGTNLEVKALPASGERKCRISNFRQLEAPKDTLLFLIGVRLKPGSTTIEQLYEQVCQLVESEELPHLEQMMKKAGCPVPIAASWNRLAFSHGAPEAWRVADSFPRLIPGMLSEGVEPDGISEVRYTISLEKAVACEIEPQVVLSSLIKE